MKCFFPICILIAKASQATNAAEMVHLCPTAPSPVPHLRLGCEKHTCLKHEVPWIPCTLRSVRCSFLHDTIINKY